VGERGAEVFEARRDADAQKSRADACEHVANRLDAELEAVFARLSASASNGEDDASVASEARLAIAKAQLLHKREFIRAADASLATQRARVEDAERRAGRACADAENAWGALRDARRFSVDRAVGGTDEEEDKGDDELGDATRRLEECEAERAALATSLDEAIRDVSVLTDDLARERAKVAGERARADAAVSALGKMETDKCAEVPAAGGDAAIAAAAAERARCVALASANVDLHAHVAELAKMPGIGDETARETAEKRLADLGVGVNVRDATDSARTAATTCAVLQTELVDVTRQLEEVTREMERMKRDKAEARERRRKFDLASPGVKSPSPTTPLNDSRLEVRASDSKLADCEARLAAANARVSFLESALVRHGASSKDGTPLGTPLGTPTKGKVLTPTPKSPLDSDVDDLRTRLAAATRRADSAEAAAAEAEATAEAASRAAVDADAACAKIQKAAGDRASAAEARAHSAELEIDDLQLEKTRLTDELLDARVEAHRAAVDAAAARAALDEASESIGEAQTGAHSTHVELVEARMETAKVRGEGALALFELARTQVTLLADGDVDGARTAAESAMDDSRDAARIWSERAARGGDGSGSAGGSMSGPAASLLESGGVASRAQQLMADALAEEMGMH
jgi:chromosome segregation ATPase